MVCLHIKVWEAVHCSMVLCTFLKRLNLSQLLLELLSWEDTATLSEEGTKHPSKLQTVFSISTEKEKVKEKHLLSAIIAFLFIKCVWSIYTFVYINVMQMP